MITGLLFVLLGARRPQQATAEISVRTGLPVERLAEQVGGFARIESRTPGTSIYLLQTKPGIDEDEADRRLNAIKGVKVLNPEEEPVDFRSIQSLNRKISNLTHDEKGDPDKRGSDKQEKEGVDYLRAYKHFVGPRAYPNDAVDWTAYARATEQIKQMQPADLNAGLGNKRPLSSGNQWSFVGPTNLDVPYSQYYGISPVNGRINAVAYDPNNSQILYAGGAQGGVWKSTDGGTTWNWLSAAWAHLAVNCIVLDPSNPSTIYVGLGDYHGMIGGSYGLMKSTDGGSTWAEIGTATMGQIGVAGIMIDPTSDQNIIAGTGDIGNATTPGYGKLYRSTNGGQTWTVVSTLADTFWPTIVASKPVGTSTRFYAIAAGLAGNGPSSVSRVYKSDDHGATWQLLSSPINTSDKTLHWAYSLATSPTNANNVYALDSEHDKIYESLNQGGTWTDITKNFPTGNSVSTNYNWSQNFYDYYIACGSRSTATTTTDLIYVGEIDIVESADNGATWQTIGGPTYSSTGTAISHNDQHCLQVCPTNPNLAVFSNDGGVYEVRYNGGGTPLNTVTNLNRNLGASMFYKIGVHPTNPAVLLGGTQDNASPFSSGDLNNWQNAGGGDGGGSAINQTSPLIQYATLEDMIVYRTNNGWGSTQNITPGIGNDPAPFVASIVLDPSVQTLMYTGTDYLYQFNDSVQTWTNRLGNQRLTGAVTSKNPDPQVFAIAVAPTDSKRLYTGSSDGQLWMSTTQGTTWKQLNAGTTALPNEAITSVSVNPVDENDILIGLSGTATTGHLWRCANTTASTLTFTSVSSSGSNALPSLSLNAIVRDLVDPVGTWWVATDIGVFRSADSGATWQNAGTAAGLPNVIVDDLAITPGTGYLTAGTFGRGMWRLQVPVPQVTVSSLSLSPNSVRRGSSATGTVTLTSPAPVGGVNVLLTSANTSVATTPASVTVPSGASSATFTVSTSILLTAPGSSVISASYNGSSATQTLSVTVPTISGTITFSQYLGTPPASVVFNFRQVGASSPFMSVTVPVAADGSFKIQNVPTQSYQVYIQPGSWLRRTLSLNLTSSDVTNADYVLLNGDINGDNRIDNTDRRLITIADGAKPGDPNWNPRADLNGDGVIDYKDFDILYRNFGRIGDQ